MTNIVEAKIKPLVALWYRLVSLDHHKDRDCHWEIVHRFSYAGEESWYVHHNGYVHRDFCKDAKSYDQALLTLYTSLCSAFQHQFEWLKMVENDPEEYDCDVPAMLELQLEYKRIISG